MNRNEHCIFSRSVFGRLLLGIVAAASSASACGAQGDDVQALEPQPWPEAETVRALLRADAAAALADCRAPGVCGPGGPPASAAAQPARRSDDIRVAAIFGTAKRLNVDVVVNGSLLRYRAGRDDPIAGAAAMDAYRLLTIDGACVRLHRDGRDHTACLDAGGPRP
ncbi:hypothetical protein [Achromobacter arsenitoxydans]|uniref:Uncharacterized protein n=1 Tax=Achromobacter arsenitoxydans SY8 TaxID=477184 RepID=H0FA47_9BURK|nr:hypothetical protein [Achromobacter arsenitoxydans]EHK64854.1 hypothetical protein KYC_18625 [Achromobacter arsenitoxydans SY8]